MKLGIYDYLELKLTELQEYVDIDILEFDGGKLVLDIRFEENDSIDYNFLSDDVNEVKNDL